MQWVHMPKNSLPDWKDALLYDPQTSGGLLIAIAPEQAQSFLAEICTMGENAAIIGTVQSGNGQIFIA
jgi:selenide,water dikinase